MSVYISDEAMNRNLKIRVVEKDGEVHLIYNNHTFVRLFEKEGQNVIDVIDADTGSILDGKRPRHIQAMCWRR